MAIADKRTSDSNPRLVGLSRAGYRALEKRGGDRRGCHGPRARR